MNSRATRTGKHLEEGISKVTAGSLRRGLDYWVDPLLKDGDEELGFKARVFSLIVMSTLSSSIVFLIVTCLSHGWNPLSYVAGSMALACSVILLTTRHWGQLERGAVAFCTCLSLAIASAEWIYGNHIVLASIWWVIVPLFATVLLGFRHAVASTISIIVIFSIVQQFAGSFGGEEKFEFGNLVESTSFVLMLLTVLAFSWIHADARAKLASAVEEAKTTKLEVSALAEAVLHTSDGIVLTTKDGTITYVNPAFEKTSGYRKEDVLGKNTRILKSGRHDPDFYSALWHSILRGETWRGVFQNERKDGTTYVEETSISAVIDSEGSVSGFVAVKRDVTERVTIQRELRHSQKMEAVGQLSAGIAHEINTPIQFVGDSIEFIREAYEDIELVLDAYAQLRTTIKGPGISNDTLQASIRIEDDIDLDGLRKELPAAFSRCHDGIRRVTTIVQAMKCFARRGDREKSSADINEALAATAAVARNEYKYVATLKLELGAIPQAVCQVADLNQVFLSLIVNAAHAIAEAQSATGTDAEMGLITVRTFTDGHDVVIEVEDTGTGIASDVQDRVFEPFFTTKGVGVGTGQGLAIAHSIVVEQHRGRIEVETEASVGSLFRVRIPIVGDATPRAAA